MLDTVVYLINHPIIFFFISITVAIYLSWKAFEWDVKNASPPASAFATAQKPKGDKQE